MKHLSCAAPVVLLCSAACGGETELAAAAQELVPASDFLTLASPFTGAGKIAGAPSDPV